MKDEVEPDRPPHEGADVDAAPPRSKLFSLLWMTFYGVALTALAFVQAGGRMVADTKFDLLTDPWGFLGQGLRLWDATAAFGQVPNQQYGYLWPMGPFFGLGELMNLPDWVVQRLWWALLLCLGFYGVLKLLRELRVGSPAAQLIAALAYVLTPRAITLIGASSAELWPMALAPWVLVPLVRATRTGSPFRAAGLSALAVCCAGGVNAVAVAATLPLGLIWLLTRAPGQRRNRLLVWWPILTIAMTLWWSAALLVMGRYAAPFLDYIENASVTTGPTDLTHTLLGFDNWVAGFGGAQAGAAYHTLNSPYILVQFVLVTALGLAGLTLRTNPHRRFLLLGVLSGLVLVGLGFTGAFDGWFAEARQDALDGALAPLRNVHKFDVVLRLPLMIGLAAALTALAVKVKELVVLTSDRRPLLAFRAMAVVMVSMMLMPWLRPGIVTAGGVEEVPGYWNQAARYLASTGDDSVTLELPASSFGRYAWGNTQDDIMQGLASSRWAVRNVIPLAEPGNVVMLDQVTKLVESGRASTTLASYLANQGVGRLLLRNDLDRVSTGAPPGDSLRAVLQHSEGISLERVFGPVSGDAAMKITEDGTRVVAAEGRSTRAPALEVYRIDRDIASAALTSDTQVMVGDPGTSSSAGLDQNRVGVNLLPEDADSLEPSVASGVVRGQVLTDGNRRHETAFAAVRNNVSATMSRDEAYRLEVREHTHRLAKDADRWQTTQKWEGDIASLQASSSQAWANAVPPIDPGRHPGAALDGDRGTSWQSATWRRGDGQWWQANFTSPQDLGQVSISVPEDSVAVKTLTLTSGKRSTTVEAPQRGMRSTYTLGWPKADNLRITLHTYEPEVNGAVALDEVSMFGVRAKRVLELPDPVEGQPITTVSLNRDPGASGCVDSEEAFNCNRWLAMDGEDGDRLDRELNLADGAEYQISATATLREGSSLWKKLVRRAGVDLEADDLWNGALVESPFALVDGAQNTTWRSTQDKSSIVLAWDKKRSIESISLVVAPSAPVSAPRTVLVRSGGKSQIVTLDDTGTAQLTPLNTKKIRITVLETAPAFLTYGDGPVQLGQGVSEILLNGESVIPAEDREVRLECGEAPEVTIGSQSFATRATASWDDLVRGRALDLEICDPAADAVSVTDPDGSTAVDAGSEDSLADIEEPSAPETRSPETTSPLTPSPAQLDRLRLSGEELRITVEPTALLRPETLTLDGVWSAESALPPTVTTTHTVPLTLTERLEPASVTLEADGGSRLLSLAQNFNPGWTARVGDRTLTPVRVEGWKQAWVIPSGLQGMVHFEFPPQRQLPVLIAGGAGVALFVVLLLVVSTWWSRRRPGTELPPVGAAPAGWLDGVVWAVALGLLNGFVGLGAGVLGLVVLVVLRSRRREFNGWGTMAAALFGVATLPLLLELMGDASWSMGWQQGWSLLAVACLATALLALVMERWPLPERPAPATPEVPGAPEESATAD